MSNHGTSHFWVQRLTAVALVPLTIWFCFSMASLPQMSHANLSAWMNSPFNATLMILVIGVGLYHGKLGLQVIAEDYIANTSKRVITNGVITMISVLFGVIGIVSVLKLSFGA